jgi:bifunctional non-homologous end joining protein LigD
MASIAEGKRRRPKPFMLNSDKPAAEVTIEQPVVMGVPITHPTKALWAGAAGDDKAVTKLVLGRYFKAVSDWMMRHLGGRPCSIIRAPDGIGGARFFQRHAIPGASNLLDFVTVSGDPKPYLQIDRPEALAALAQAATLELRPWNCQPHRPEVPGRLVFDLDPGPDVPLAGGVEAAKALHERLHDLGLIAFCKTTGGKGLHVMVPLAAATRHSLGWPEAKAFARELCRRLAQAIARAKGRSRRRSAASTDRNQAHDKVETFANRFRADCTRPTGVFGDRANNRVA